MENIEALNVIPANAGISCRAYFMFCHETLKQVQGDDKNVI